jgi:hypothetical protein
MQWIVIPALKEINMNFHELSEKLRKIDTSTTLMEDTSVQECGEMPGMMGMPHAMPGMPQPQQDTVSMNVSMNAQGKNGIRDLMNVLKNIEDATQHAPHYNPVDDLDGAEIEIDGPAGELEIDHGESEMGHAELEPGEHHGDMEIIDDETLGAEESEVTPEQKIKAAAAASISDADMAEEYANRPDVTHQGINYMTKTLSGGLNKQHQQDVRPGQPAGVNPMKEGLLGQLASLYQEVKLRESK